jgi:hypothetical protein
VEEQSWLENRDLVDGVRGEVRGRSGLVDGVRGEVRGRSGLRFSFFFNSHFFIDLYPLLLITASRHDIFASYLLITE